MKTVLQIQIGKFFTIIQDNNVSGFLRIDETKNKGLNAICIKSDDPTYYKSQYYYIQHDQPVIEALYFQS